MAQALGILRGDIWVEEIGEGLTELKVHVKQPAVEHRVRMKDFRRWLESQGRTPAECTRKSKLMALAKGEGRERWSAEGHCLACVSGRRISGCQRPHPANAISEEFPARRPFCRMPALRLDRSAVKRTAVGVAFALPPIRYYERCCATT